MRYPKVLHILEPEPAGSIGGADTHVLTLAEIMGADVFINQNPDFEASLHQLGIGVQGGASLAAGKLRSALALRAAILRRHYDLLHSHGYDANVILLLARLLSGRVRRIPVVMTAHGWVEKYLSHRIKTWVDIHTHRYASGIILCAAHQRERVAFFRKHGPITIIPNGVIKPETSAPLSAAARLCHTLKADGYTLVGCVGRLSREKNWAAAIRAFSYSALAGRGRLVLVGAGPEEAALKALVRDLGMGDSIFLTGFAPDIANVYASLDLLLHTSLTETTSRVTLEAMACGIPVIVTRVGGLAQIVTDRVTGLHCDPQDLRSVIAALDWAHTNREAFGKLGEAGRAHQEAHYSLAAASRAVSAFYAKVLTASDRCDEN